MDSLDASSFRQRARIATFCLGAVIVTDVVSMFGDYSLLQFVNDVANGLPASDERANSVDSYNRAAGSLQLLALLLSAIFFCRWFHRAHGNLSTLGITELKYTPGWAVGGFFVPFLNLVRPYQVMSEVWKRSMELWTERPSAHIRANPPRDLVGLWWAGFLLTSFAGNLSGQLMLRAEGLDQIRIAASVTLVANLVDIPAAIVAMLLLGAVTRLQTALLTTDGATELAYPGYDGGR